MAHEHVPFLQHNGAVLFGAEVELNIHSFHLMPAVLLATVLLDIMNPQSTLNPSKALEGVHGIHVVPHSPFSLEEITQQGDFSQSTSGSLLNKENQRLLLQRVWEQRPGCLRPIKCCINGQEKFLFQVLVVYSGVCCEF